MSENQRVKQSVVEDNLEPDRTWFCQNGSYIGTLQEQVEATLLRRFRDGKENGVVDGKTIFIDRCDRKEIAAVSVHTLSANQTVDDAWKCSRQFQAPKIEYAYFTAVAVFERAIVDSIFGYAMGKAMSAEGYLGSARFCKAS